jgi:AcrR family transcriptional regulator
MRRRLAEPTRAALVRGLELYVLSHGFARATVDDLAAWLRCSKSTLYGLARSKEQIILAVLRAFLARLLADADRISAGESTVDGRLRAYLEEIQRAHTAIAPAALADVLDHPATRALYESTMDTIRRRVGELVGAGIGAGTFREVSAPFVGAIAALFVDRPGGPAFLLDSLAPRPNSLAPRPNSLAPRPNSLAPRPNSLAPRPNSLAPRPNAVAS